MAICFLQSQIYYFRTSYVCLSLSQLTHLRVEHVHTYNNVDFIKSFIQEEIESERKPSELILHTMQIDELRFSSKNAGMKQIFVLVLHKQRKVTKLI